MGATYATFGDVQARLPGRRLETAAKPSQAQIEAWLAEGEAMLKGRLAAASIGLPEVGSEGAGVLRSWICDYAEGHVRMAHAATNGEAMSDAGKELLDAFRQTCIGITRYPAEYGPMLAGGSVPSVAGVRGSNTDTAADDYIAPEFERDEVW